MEENVDAPPRRQMGPKVFYGPKEPPPRSHLLTAFAKRMLAAAVARSGQNESQIVEHLVRQHAASVVAADFATAE